MQKLSLVFLLILVPTLVSAHSGKTDANGCHKDKKAGTTHCHVSSSSKAALKKAAPAAKKAVEKAVTKKASSSSKSESSAAAASCTIKGNIAKDGEKIFHVEGCQSYGATKIDTSAGEKWFCSEEEAKKAGWRKALNCP
jgi:hypothetical protein